MRLAICNETFQDWPIDRAFAEAREAGYEGMEIAPFTLGGDVDSIGRKQREEVVRAASDTGLEVIGLHWLLAQTEGLYLTSPEAAVRQRTAAYLRGLAELCRDLGGHVMVLGSPQQRNLLPGVTHDQAVRYAADVIAQALPAFEQFDVILAVEPLGPQEGDFLLTADSARPLIESLDSPFVRLHLDVKAMSSEAKPIEQIIRENAQWLEHFHANDANRRGPGMGDVDFRPILQALRAIGYNKWVSVEVFDYEPGIESLVHDSIRYLRECLAETADPTTME